MRLQKYQMLQQTYTRDRQEEMFDILDKLEDEFTLEEDDECLAARKELKEKRGAIP
ncbi:uncharacterized protein ARB_05033 [Trichophyton benhamiae CBS 112371]|uniref:Uncharacterized protein n=1 Tax=Arthroderma benhamiae (strain ATCC MYA-4681 / CBS 112371) TaxID=663331 RepID=D4AL37_ARTBC|nr:uncharacterized protein ARB_05033 [Trichophyton benhamiae CBS 112371]EFE36096.1 hypothetical protein ARB_05033 [Trichophyton benhamiae CBS 112371]